MNKVYMNRGNNMKAMVLKDISKGLSLEDIDKPKVKANEVIIKLKKVALNRRDLMIVSGQYPNTTLPSVIGSDGAGTVEALGNNITRFSIGDEVIINPGLHWGTNPNVKSTDFTILGMPENGTFAEYVKVPVENVHMKPQHLTWAEAAALPLSALTGYRAIITKGQVKPGENVLIPGAGGGVATYMIQFAKAIGANVYITSSKVSKINQAIELGAKNGVNYTESNWVEQLSDMTNGIDLSVDSIGGESFMSLFNLGKIGSRIVNFGATNGPVPQFILPMMTLKEITLIGSTMGSPKDFKDMLDFVSEHKIKPIVDRIYDLNDVNIALNSMKSGDNMGKIVLNIDNL